MHRGLCIICQKRSDGYITVTPDAIDPTKTTANLAGTSETVPDIRHRYKLQNQHNPFFNDRLCVSVGSDTRTGTTLTETGTGMLNSIEYATEDATR